MYVSQADVVFKYYNKRAQKALGLSPEEKVKGHSGANNREPQGHNLNNLSRGPLDDAIYQIWKLWALLFQTRRLFNVSLKPIYWPRDLLMKPTGTVWTTLIGDHPRIIPVMIGQIPISGFRGDVVKRNCRRMHGLMTDIERSQKLTEHFLLRWTKEI